MWNGRPEELRNLQNTLSKSILNSIFYILYNSGKHMLELVYALRLCKLLPIVEEGALLLLVPDYWESLPLRNFTNHGDQTTLHTMHIVLCFVVYVQYCIVLTVI